MPKFITLHKLSVDMVNPNTSFTGLITINSSSIAYYETDTSKRLPKNLSISKENIHNHPTKITTNYSRHPNAIAESFWVAESFDFLQKTLKNNS